MGATTPPDGILGVGRGAFRAHLLVAFSQLMVAAVCEQVLVDGVVSHRDVDSWWGFRLLDALPHRRRCGLDCGRVDPSCRPQQLLLGKSALTDNRYSSKITL